MTAINCYVSVNEFKNYATNRGQTATSDYVDDQVIEDLLEQTSRYIDEQTSRTFYPRVETRYHSVPTEGNDRQKLYFDDDLLEIISVTNGDDNTIASTYYNLLPRNDYPKYAIRLLDTASITWEPSSAGEYEYVIDIAALWGYHNQYSQRAWITGTTLGSALNNSSTSATVTSAALFSPGQIIRVDNELAFIKSVASSTSLTLEARGENGSTAAAHDNGSTVYIWQPMRTVRDATMMIAHRAYSNRLGQASQGSVTVTAAGVVIRPEDVPARAQVIIDGLAPLI